MTSILPIVSPRELSPSKLPVTPQKLNSLTSLRFVAAALIVFGHCAGQLYLLPSFTGPFQIGQAVSFFFILSGFILAYVYPSLESGSKAAKFLVARFARVWPAQVIALVIYVWVAGWAVPFSWKVVAANLAMIQSWIPPAGWKRGYNDPSWSIATEFAFYLCFPLLIQKFNRRWPIWLVGSFSLACMMIAISNRLHLGSVYLDDSDGALGRVHTEDLVYFHPAGRIFEFVLGMCLCLVFRRIRPIYRLGSVFSTLLEVLSIALVIGSMYESEAWSAKLWSINWIGLGGYIWLNEGGIPAIPFAILIFIMAIQRGAVSRFLSLPLFVILGEISFSVYLLHWSLLTYYLQHSTGLSVVPGWLLFTAFWIVLLLMSHLNWRMIESPAREWITGAFGRFSSPAKSKKSTHHPARRTVVAEIILATAIVASVIYVASYRSAVHEISQIDAAALATRANSGADSFNFAHRFTLRSARVEPRNGGIELELVWQSRNLQHLTYNVGVHLMDDAANIITYADYPQDTNIGWVTAGTLWMDRIHIPPDQVKDATQIGLCLYSGNPTVMLPIDQGHRDSDNRRLLMTLPTEAGNQTIGHIETVRGDSVTGWAWNPQHSNAPVMVEIYEDGVLAKTINADLFRRDLANAHVGNGNHGFSIALPTLADGKPTAYGEVCGFRCVLPQLKCVQTRDMCYPCLRSEQNQSAFPYTDDSPN